jgi:hypothetical protein
LEQLSLAFDTPAQELLGVELVKKRYASITALSCLLIVLFASLSVLAQDACPELVKKALSQLANNCDGLDRNSACYGFNRVDATFSGTVADNFFSTPADRSQLALLQSIATAPLDSAENRWGIAVLNVQANVPNTLPGQGVVFMLLGDVKVQNAVPADQAFEGGTPVSVTTRTSANLRSSPSTKANVVGSAAANTSFQADALSIDKQWLRVLYADGPAWLNRNLVQSDGNIDSLPAIDKDTRSPMQAFYFSTGIGKAACSDAPPSALVVQGPKHVKVAINANGADITIGSTIFLRLLAGNKMQLVVLSGGATIGGFTLPAGFTANIQLNADGTNIDKDAVWEGVRPLTQDEIDELLPLENIPPELLHYAIIVPSLDDIQQTLLALQAASKGGNGGQNPTQGDCGAFKPTSPIGSMPFDHVTFYWDPMPGATSYRFRISNEGGVIKEVETTDTNVPLDATDKGIGLGSNFFWQVDALVNGGVVCTSALIPVTRRVDPNYHPPAPPQPASTPAM